MAILQPKYSTGQLYDRSWLPRRRLAPEEGRNICAGKIFLAVFSLGQEQYLQGRSERRGNLPVGGDRHIPPAVTEHAGRSYAEADQINAATWRREGDLHRMRHSLWRCIDG